MARRVAEERERLRREFDWHCLQARLCADNAEGYRRKAEYLEAWLTEKQRSTSVAKAKEQATTTVYRRLHGLTVEQENAIDLLVTGSTDREAADAAGVNRVTVTKWRLRDVVFQATLNRRRQEVWAGAADKLRTLIPTALDTLGCIMTTAEPAVRVSAAVWVLRLAGIGAVAAPRGETDAVKIVDGMVREKRDAGDPESRMIRQLVGDHVSDAERDAVLAELASEVGDDGGEVEAT